MKKRFWLIEKRLSRGLNQMELAKRCNASNQTISNIETGKRTPSGLLAKRISDVLDFDMSRFYEEDDSQSA